MAKKSVKKKAKKSTSTRGSKKKVARKTKKTPAKKTARKAKKAPAKKTAKAKRGTAKSKTSAGKRVERAASWPPPEDLSTYFDPLDMLRKVLAAQDMLFLSRQTAYYVEAESSIHKAWADLNQVKETLASLIEHIVKRSPRRSRITMRIGTHSLRSGPGVEIQMEGTDHALEGIDVSTFVATLFSDKPDPESGISLAEIRNSVTGMHGRMWVDLPKPDRPLYHIVLPTTEKVSEMPQVRHQTFKYDILISNYSNVRKRFGIRKSLSLVEQIEHYVRSLVRYPIDMVMSAGERGTITTIYETQGGAAESVASRISQRLAREAFHIGRKPVELVFRYRLSALTHKPSDRTKETQKRRR